MFGGINNPDNDEIKYYYPTSDLVTGPDIIFGGIEAISFLVIIQYLLAMAAAYFGSTFGISIMRSMVVRAGYEIFSYYCWGMALISMILYLTT